jgi:hypothetical protein
VYGAFVSGKGSGLYVFMTDIAFHLLALSFLVGRVIMVSHSAFISWGTYSCDGWLGGTDHGLCFVWVCLEAHAFEEVNDQISCSLECIGV